MSELDTTIVDWCEEAGDDPEYVSARLVRELSRMARRRADYLIDGPPAGRIFIRRPRQLRPRPRRRVHRRRG